MRRSCDEREGIGKDVRIWVGYRVRRRKEGRKVTYKDEGRNSTLFDFAIHVRNEHRLVLMYQR